MLPEQHGAVRIGFGDVSSTITQEYSRRRSEARPALREEAISTAKPSWRARLAAQFSAPAIEVIMRTV